LLPTYFSWSGLLTFAGFVHRLDCFLEALGSGNNSKLAACVYNCLITAYSHSRNRVVEQNRTLQTESVVDYAKAQVERYWERSILKQC
jgi:hypothetical protein